MESIKEAEHDLWHHVRRQFLEEVPATLTGLRLLLHERVEVTGPGVSLAVFSDLYARARSMTTSASMAGFRNLADGRLGPLLTGSYTGVDGSGLRSRLGLGLGLRIGETPGRT